MSIQAPVRLRIERDVIGRVYRFLRGTGNITLQINQEVTPDEIIGTAEVSSGFRTINITNTLSVPPDQIHKYLKINLGQKIYNGELLAYRDKWLFGGKKVIISPTDGILDFINPKTGEVRITFNPKRVNLPAGVFGIVEKVDSHLGYAVIKTQVTKIYGILGSGKIRDGILNILTAKDAQISKDMISLKQGESIIIGGSLLIKDVISASISSGINGIIVGGISSGDYKSIVGGRLNFPKKFESDIGVSIVVTEGFGSIPIGEDIYSVLGEFNGRFAVVDGNSATITLPSYQSSSIIRVRNTKLPPLTSLSQSVDGVKMSELKIDQKVRVVGASFIGEQGKIIAIDTTKTMMDSGLKSFMVTIETRRRKIQIPGNNLEII